MKRQSARLVPQISLDSLISAHQINLKLSSKLKSIKPRKHLIKKRSVGTKLEKKEMPEGQLVSSGGSFGNFNAAAVR